MDFDEFKRMLGIDIDPFEYTLKDLEGRYPKSTHGHLYTYSGLCVMYPSGTLCWFKDENYEVLHREDGPAIIQPDGNMHWFRDGKPYIPSAHEKLKWEEKKSKL